MASPYFRIARNALGLTAQEISVRINKSLRSVRLYESGRLDPPSDAAAKTSDLVKEMAHKLQPYLGTRSGKQTTFTLYDYSTEEEFQTAAGNEYVGWSLGQYRAFLGHLIVLLEAKGLSYQLVQKERKES